MYFWHIYNSAFNYIVVYFCILWPLLNSTEFVEKKYAFSLGFWCGLHYPNIILVSCKESLELILENCILDWEVICYWHKIISISCNVYSAAYLVRPYLSRALLYFLILRFKLSFLQIYDGYFVYFVERSIMVNSLSSWNPMIDIEVVKTFFFYPENIPIILVPDIFSLLEGINNAKPNLRPIG